MLNVIVNLFLFQKFIYQTFYKKSYEEIEEVWHTLGTESGELMSKDLKKWLANTGMQSVLYLSKYQVYKYTCKYTCIHVWLDTTKKTWQNVCDKKKLEV